MTEHEYDDQAVTRFAALATGGGPRTQVKWAQVSPDTLLILADLLENAAAIGWSNEQLDQAVRAAHQSSRQNSTAGRFSALANHITDLAETRAMESSMRAEALREDPDQHPGTSSDGARPPSSRAPKQTPMPRPGEQPAPRMSGGNRPRATTTRGVVTRTPSRAPRPAARPAQDGPRAALAE